MTELKACPFCGGKAEIYTGRNFPHMGKSLCTSEEEARGELKKYMEIGTVHSYRIGSGRMQRANMKTPKTKWGVVVEMKAFIPRCCKSGCLGRTQNMFLSEKEAAESWNTRHDSSESQK